MRTVPQERTGTTRPSVTDPLLPEASPYAGAFMDRDHESRHMDRESVSSSLLSSVGYDPERQRLEIELQDGKIYQYTDVPAETYRGLMDADSHGRYFNRHIRGLKYHRLR
jgi:hypothetical protein